MSGIRTNAAAVMLGVSPNTLRSWERRYGFPCPRRSPGGHRQYALSDVEALRSALAQTHNVSSAIAVARQRGEGPPSSSRLASAFAAFDEDTANRLLEESLALRSVERTIEDLLLQAVALRGEDRNTGAEYEFAWRYASGWLAALKRVSPPAQRSDGILVLDASASLDLDALYAQALEVVLRRAGLRTLLLSPEVDPMRLGRALRALVPCAVVLTGRRITLDGIGRVVFAVRTARREALVCDYRGAVPSTAAAGVSKLGDAPMGARDALLALLDAAGPVRTGALAGFHAS
ncbi:MAG TPA: MerR family transcriptional regulator [Solirubrobacteraceae bacterium]